MRIDIRDPALPATDIAPDCPECRSAGSVRGSVCEICFAELDESPARTPPSGLGDGPPRTREGSDEAAGPPPAASSPLRFADVIAELQAIAAVARGAAGPEGPAIAEACGRAERLLASLRRQFVSHVAT